MSPAPQPAVPPSEVTDLVALARWRASVNPDQIGYTFLADGETDEQNLTYAELDRQARAVAARLRAVCAPGDRALLLYDPGLEFVAAFFGCLYAGAVPVPAYPPDPLRHDRTLPRLRAITDDCHPTAVLGTGESLGRARPLLAGPLARAAVVATDDVAASTELGWQPPAVAPDDLAFLQYTSGSTDTPRGVMISHRNLLTQVGLIHGTDVDNAVGVSWLPVYHDLGLIAGVLATLYSGRRIVSMSPLAFVQCPLRWLWAISRYRATTTGGPDFAYALCARKFRPADAVGLDLSCWRIAMSGAELVRPETLERFNAVFAPYGFRPETWMPSYGLAEATLGVTRTLRGCEPAVTAFDVADLAQGRTVQVETTARSVRRLVGCGAPMEGYEVVIVDPQQGTVLPDGAVGEVWACGPSVALGYWNRPADTAATFGGRLADDPGRGPFLRTGDLGFFHAGQLYPVGRLKEMMVFYGRNVYPQDVEATVTRCHAALKEHGGAAFAVEVNDEERLVVVQEVSGPNRFDLDELAREVRRAILLEHRVPPFALVFLKQGTLPKTSSGKVQRLEARAQLLRGGLSVVRRWEFGGAGAADPTTRTEAEIRDWLRARVAAQCGLPETDVDVSRPLGAYVLDSITLVSLALELETWLGGPVDPVLIADAPSAEELARRLAGEPAAAVVDELSEPELDRQLAHLLEQMNGYAVGEAAGVRTRP